MGRMVLLTLPVSFKAIVSPPQPSLLVKWIRRVALSRRRSPRPTPPAAPGLGVRLLRPRAGWDVLPAGASEFKAPGGSGGGALDSWGSEARERSSAGVEAAVEELKGTAAPLGGRQGSVRHLDLREALRLALGSLWGRWEKRSEHRKLAALAACERAATLERRRWR